MSVLLPIWDSIGRFVSGNKKRNCNAMIRGMTSVHYVFEKRASHLILATDSTNTHAFRCRVKPFLTELGPLQSYDERSFLLKME